MKTTSRTLSAAFLAALFALASCDKSDIAVGGGIQQPTGGSRVIAVSFQNNSTKTILDDTDGLTPKFEDKKDQIKVANGIDAPEICTVSVEGDVATITTSLSGPLTMVYPASAAKMSGNAIDGVLVPTEQDGTFASANICMAEDIAEGATSATFENQTAVFKITPGAGADTKYVEVITAGAEIANYDSEGNYPTLHKIHVVTTSADPVYVSILVPVGLKICNLGFADGYNIKGLKDNTTTIAKNTLYNVDAENWNRPYVEIGGRKWATMNVGATTVAGNASTCYGDYFAWGETTGHKLNDEMEAPADEHDFSWSTAPFNNGSSYDSEYFTTNKSEWLTDNVLKPAYDAATANWGSSWRMPSPEDFESLWTACTGDEEEWECELESLPETITAGGVYSLTSDQTYLSEYIGVAGMLFVDKSDISKRVFFPAAGVVDGTSFYDGGTGGSCWSSSLATDYPNYAYILHFYDWLVSPSIYNLRYVGFTVRPFSE